VLLELLYTSPAQKLKNCCGKRTSLVPHMGSDRTRAQVLRNLLLWRGPHQQHGAGETARCISHPPFSMHFTCWASPASKQTFNMFRK